LIGGYFQSTSSHMYENGVMKLIKIV
jgi:hypothetical protein